MLAVVLALSGAMVSLDPALERWSHTVAPEGQISVAALAGRVALHYPGVEQIQRSPSGSIVVYYSRDGQPSVDRVDPQSGQSKGAPVVSPVSRWMKTLHRSWFLDTPGRVVSGVVALAMAVLSVSGAVLLVRRVGGWRHLAEPLRGTGVQRWHAQVARGAVLGLLLSALTGMYLSATTLELISDGTQSEADFPPSVAGGPVAPVATLPALVATDLNHLRELVYPSPGDVAGVYSLTTDQGEGYIDPSSGVLLSYLPHGGLRQTYELIYQLHTGEGVWWLGLLLGACALSVPLLSVTGALTWWQQRPSMPRLVGNSAASVANTVIGVGSENNSTWGFAHTLHEALRQTGLRVHTVPMNQLAHHYPHAERLFILTATYGDGDAPRSANQFLARLGRVHTPSHVGFAVLGFGDRQFPKFCKFAFEVEAALLAQGRPRLLDTDTIDRQSGQAFTRWGKAVGLLIGQELNLVHTPRRPRTDTFVLIARTDYGEAVQAPTRILRFAAAPPHGVTARLRQRLRGHGLPRFEGGDWLGVVPPGSTLPRFYSLASQSSDGFLEICVRKLPGGQCSTFLHDLALGGRMEAFVQWHPEFRPVAGQTPVILMGSGTGIGPLAGFIRNNTAQRPMFLYWGGRDPASDFLYQPELKAYLADGRLTGLNVVFSRIKEGGYVQDRVRAHATQLRQQVVQGAQVRVCGGRAMAHSVAQAWDDILAPLNLSVARLTAQGRYREDVF